MVKYVYPTRQFSMSAGYKKKFKSARTKEPWDDHRALLVVDWAMAMAMVNGLGRRNRQAARAKLSTKV